MIKKRSSSLLFFLFLIGLTLPGNSHSQSADDGFNPNANDYSFSIALQPDGKILVGGPFSSIGGQTRNYIARLNPNGALDENFNANADEDLRSIALQDDGKILVGGWFSSIGGQVRNRIARLSTDEAAVHSLSVSRNGRTITWMRGQSSPELWRVTFEDSLAG